MQYKLTTPVTREDLAPLQAGDTVLLSGTVYTARDAAHQRMMELLDEGRAPPLPRGGRRRLLRGPHPGAARARSSAPPAPPPAAGWTPTPPACWTWG